MDPRVKISSKDSRLDTEWKEAGQQGKESFTWISNEWVLQERSITALNKAISSLKILEPLKNDPLFKSAAGDILEVNNFSFFSIWPRIQGKHFRYPENNIFADWQELKEHLPAMGVCLEKLHQLNVSRETFLGCKNEIVTANLTGSEWVLAGLESMGIENMSLPKEPKSKWAVSHGDLGLQNIMVHNKEVFLIDWVTISALPLHSDAAHFVESLLYRLDHNDWGELLSESHCLAPQLTYDEWVASVIWSALRSFIIWPSPKSQVKVFTDNIKSFLD
jgi:hypothetical protein